MPSQDPAYEYELVGTDEDANENETGKPAVKIPPSLRLWLFLKRYPIIISLGVLIFAVLVYTFL